MVPYLNDTEAWNRQGERHLRETHDKLPVHPGIALSKYARPGAAGGKANAPASRYLERVLSAAR